MEQPQSNDDDRISGRCSDTACSRSLKGIEDRVWVCVEGCDRVYAIADEDIERETAEKTASVHFLRFELDAAMIADAGRSRSRWASIIRIPRHPGSRARNVAVPAKRPRRDASHRSLLLAMISGCGADGSKPHVVLQRRPGRPSSEKALVLPPYPQEKNLLEFAVGPTGSRRYFIDRQSLSVGADGIVRYTVIVRAAGGAVNATYEGIRCIPAQSGSMPSAAEENGSTAKTDGPVARDPPACCERISGNALRDYFCPEPADRPQPGTGGAQHLAAVGLARSGVCRMTCQSRTRLSRWISSGSST